MRSGAICSGLKARTNWLSAVALSSVLLASPVVAQEARAISIPAEDAGAAIQDLTRQSGLQVFAPAEDLRGVRTNAVKGSFTPLEAARRLVAGTGLEVMQTADNAVTLRKPAKSSEVVPPSAPPGEGVETVVVTGSRIKRAGFDTLEAATSISSEQLNQRGYTNVLDALQAQPEFGPPGSSSLASEQARAGIGQSFADFFGLGSQRTLTLVDGHRFVSSNSPAANGSNGSPGSQVDLNLIPVSLIDHVETVAIGGAPVYGADAIAGTINIILKDNYQGEEVSGQYGVSDQGDAESYTFRGLFGTNFDDGRGNVVVSAEFNHQTPLVMADRFGLLYALPNAAGTGLMFNPNTTLAFTTEGGLPYDGSILNIPGLHYPGLYPNGNYIFNSSGQPMRFAPNGQLVPFNIGTVADAANLGGGISIPLYASGGDGVNAADHFGLLAETTRTLFNANGHYDIAPNIHFFIESSYAHTEGVLPSDLTSIVAPNIIGAESLSFSVNNPYLSSQAQSIIQAQGLSTFNLSANLNDIVDRMPARTVEDVYRIVGGFEGSFSAWGESWSWNASYNYGSSTTHSYDTYVDPTKLLLAADAVMGPSGNIVCASGGSCVPIDLFGENAFSSAAANYVVDLGEGVGVNTQQDAVANLSGDLPLSIAGADNVKFNVGYEHRVETANFNPNAVYVAGDQIDGVPGYSAVSGSFYTNEVYGETVVPVVTDSEGLSWVKSASLEGAIRYVDNSVAGGATTWSSGARFAPRAGGWLDGLLFRGVYMRAIRDPAVEELYLPSSGVLNGILDPCDASQVNGGPDPSVREANCTKGLAAVGAGSPSGFHSTTEGVSVAGTESGNSSLSNEKSDSWSLGTVYQPVDDPHFRFSADWNNVRLTNGITLLDINSILDACYDDASYPSTSCSLFSRLTPAQAAGSTTPRNPGDIAPGYKETYINASSINFSGLILQGQYNNDVAAFMPNWVDSGSFNLGGQLFYLHRYDTVDFEGDPVSNVAGTIGYPKYKSQLMAGYNWHEFDTSWQATWSSATIIDYFAASEGYPQWKVPDYWLFSATFGYQATEMFHLQLVVNNLFDRHMPTVAQEAEAFSVYDPIGRSYLIRITADF